MKSLPPEFDQCSKLQGLDLYDLRFNFLPPEIGRLTALGHLDCAQNLLTDLPSEFSQLYALQQVDFFYNPFIEILRSFYHLLSIRHAKFIYNQLTHMYPEIFIDLPLLESLKIGCNPLRTIFGLLQQEDPVSGWVVPFYVQLPPNVMDLLNHWNNSTFTALQTYYAKRIRELILELLHTRHLTPGETDRLVHKATLDEHTILGDHLPPITLFRIG